MLPTAAHDGHQRDGNPVWTLTGRRVCLVALSLLALLVALSTTAQAAPARTEGWTQVVEGGFNDPNNSYAPSRAEFKDYFYLSTSANEAGSVFSGSSKAGGDIWRTVDGTAWEQIGSPGLGDTDNMTFRFVVFRDRLYAISINTGNEGFQIFVTSDGKEFTRVGAAGLGNKNNSDATGFVFADRLILATSNVGSGAEIWVSLDGDIFERAVAGGMGDPGVTGFSVPAGEKYESTIFQGRLYIGVSNPDSGGEIWRTSDGREWERVADQGLGRTDSVVLYPEIVYKDQLYAFGGTAGMLDKIAGVDLFRTSDGTTWEQVIDDGFKVGVERNVIGDLTEFRGRLYLTTSNMDPRLLVPGNPTERHSPRGFQLRVSDDGKTWTQIGDDGFGSENSFLAGMLGHADTSYLTVTDYHEGNQLWRSSNGEDWELVFREPDPNFFQEGAGPVDFKGHFLWISNDLKNGVEIWRSDDVLLAEETTTTSSAASGTEGGETVNTADGGTNGSGETDGGEGGGQTDTAQPGGLSGAWLVVIIVVAVIAAVALIAVAFLVGRSPRSQGRSSGSTTSSPGGTASPPANVASSTGGDAGTTGETQPPRHPGAPSFCSKCGSPLDADAVFCPNCGRRL